MLHEQWEDQAKAGLNIVRLFGVLVCIAERKDAEGKTGPGA